MQKTFRRRSCSWTVGPLGNVLGGSHSLSFAKPLVVRQSSWQASATAVSMLKVAGVGEFTNLRERTAICAIICCFIFPHLFFLNAQFFCLADAWVQIYHQVSGIVCKKHVSLKCAPNPCFQIQEISPSCELTRPWILPRSQSTSFGSWI